MKQHRMTGIAFGLLGVMAFSVIGLIGCRQEDRHDSLSGPALPVDESAAKRTEFNKRNPAQYTPGTVPGIAVTMDFTEYHIDGRPYGDWTLHASWRACRKGCPELVTADVPVAIDANGQGTAHIPSSFLNAVFQLAQQKFEEGKDELGVWWNAQALVLDLGSSGSFRDYYDVDLGRDGWTYELSAGAVAGGMQQALAALGIGWYLGKPGDVPQDLALALHIGRCISITETSPVTITETSPVTLCPTASAAPLNYRVNAQTYCQDGYVWVLAINKGYGGTCTNACIEAGFTGFASSATGYFTNAEYSASSATDACQAILNGLAAGGRGGALKEYINFEDECGYWISGYERFYSVTYDGWYAEDITLELDIEDACPCQKP